MPIFTSNRYGDRKYVVLPISNVTVSPRNRKKMDRIAKVLGNGISTNKEVKFRDYREKKAEKEETFTPVAPDLSKVTEFPVEYNSGKFIYQLYQDHACLSGFCEDRENFSYSIDGEILGLPITEMSEGCFEGFKQIKKMNFNKGITKISAYAFKGCSDLEGFQLGRSVSRIGKEAFADCGMLSAAVMKNKVKNIGSRAFANDTALRTVKIPESVTSIADDAFENCNQLTIYCEKDTYAEEYANAHGINCVIMDLQ